VTPQEAIHWVEKNMFPVFPLKVFKDRGDGVAAAPPAPMPKRVSVPEDASGPSTQAAAGSGAVAQGELSEVAMILSGFGGQGVLFSGLALAEGGLREGLQVSWIPSYGPEMRGGTAHCHVRISREPIASPLINRPYSLMAFNQPSVEKFAPGILPGGLLLVNSSMVTDLPERTDIQIVRVAAYEAASEMGNVKTANMIMLGAYLEVTRAVEQESVISALAENGMRPALLKSNREGIETGRRLVSGIGREKSKYA
jgi:2-oxoglutarate ferredoxin oxidoreductase subunit gamma